MNPVADGPLMLDGAARPRLAQGNRLRFDKVRGAWMVLAPERVVMLDDIAADIVQRCDGAASIDAVIDGLAESYAAERAEIAADVVAMIAGLLEKRVMIL